MFWFYYPSSVQKKSDNQIINIKIKKEYVIYKLTILILYVHWEWGNLTKPFKRNDERGVERSWKLHSMFILFSYVCLMLENLRKSMLWWSQNMTKLWLFFWKSWYKFFHIQNLKSDLLFFEKFWGDCLNFFLFWKQKKNRSN